MYTPHMRPFVTPQNFALNTLSLVVLVACALWFLRKEDVSRWKIVVVTIIAFFLIKVVAFIGLMMGAILGLFGGELVIIPAITTILFSFSVLLFLSQEVDISRRKKWTLVVLFSILSQIHLIELFFNHEMNSVFTNFTQVTGIETPLTPSPTPPTSEQSELKNSDDDDDSGKTPNQ